MPNCAKEPEDPEKYLLAPGDILVSRAGSVGLSHLIRACPRAIFASYLIRFRPRPPIVSGFVALFMKSSGYWTGIADETTGIAIPNVNATKLSRIELPLPPLPEQKRIVSTVEDLLARVKTAKERLRSVQAVLKRFRQSVLAAACSGRLTKNWRTEHSNAEPAAEFLKGYGRKGSRESIDDTHFGVGGDDLPDGWASCNLESLFCVQTGTTPSRKRADFYEGGTIPWVKTGEVQNGDIFSTEERVTELALEQTSLKILPTGTILIAMYGEGRTRGQVGRLRIPATTNQACAALVNPGLPPETTDYLFLYCQSLYAEFREAAVGGNQPNLNLGKVRKRRVSLPPFEEQCEISRRVQALSRLSDVIERRVVFAAGRADRLTQAILSKAFRGKLVPTEAELARREGRDYESASVLLGRIYASGGGVTLGGAPTKRALVKPASGRRV